MILPVAILIGVIALLSAFAYYSSKVSILVSQTSPEIIFESIFVPVNKVTRISHAILLFGTMALFLSILGMDDFLKADVLVFCVFTAIFIFSLLTIFT